MICEIGALVRVVGAKRVVISISEADLLGGMCTPHRSLRSLCVVLTISQRLRRCAAVAADAFHNTDYHKIVWARIFTISAWIRWTYHINLGVWIKVCGFSWWHSRGFVVNLSENVKLHLALRRQL